LKLVSKRARREPVGHVVYVDYPLGSPHLKPLLGLAGVVVTGPSADGKYADTVVVPVEQILLLWRRRK